MRKKNLYLVNSAVDFVYVGVDLIWRFTNYMELTESRRELFRGWLVFKAHRLLYSSTLGSRAMKKKKKRPFSASGKASPCRCSPGTPGSDFGG